MVRPAERLPEPFLERLRRIIPAARWEAALQTFAQPHPTTFRVNTLKRSADAVREQLTGDGFRLERVPWYPDAFILRSGRLRDLQGTVLYRSGALYVQSLSSMLPPLALDPQPGETVLDIAAAPGSKTTQMSCLMRGQGRLVANDHHKVRFFKLKANVELQWATNVRLTLHDGLFFGRRQPGAFDRVLVDAPCTSEGRFRIAAPKSYRFWKPAKIRDMVHKQKPLLYSAITALRPGGALVYSTCTFAPEENEGVIQWALEKFGEAIALEPIELDVANWTAGLAQWEQTAFHPSMHLARRILPTDDMEGFFLARLCRRACG